MLGEVSSPIVTHLEKKSVRSGYAGDDDPALQTSACAGRTRRSLIGSSIPQQETNTKIQIGNDALRNQKGLKLSYPLAQVKSDKCGFLQLLIENLLENLAADADVHPFLLTGSAAFENLNQLSENLFETFGVPGLALVPREVLALEALGDDTGIVVYSEDGTTSVIPVYAGSILKYASLHLDVDLDEFMLYQLDPSIQPFYDNDVVRKHLLLENLLADAETKVRRSDGSSVIITWDKIDITSPLLDPSVSGSNSPGVPNMIHNVLKRVDPELKEIMAKNVVLVGGNFRCEHLRMKMQERIVETLRLLGSDVCVHSPSNPDVLAWRAGSERSSAPTFSQFYASASEYKGYGPNITKIKFL